MKEKEIEESFTLGCIFYSPIFISFGLGLILSRVLGWNSGFFYVGLGFTLLIIGIIKNVSNS
jgi:energy-converting hydrogenase Eha subunit A